MSKRIVLDVVQGVGDIFWIYQKVSPYFDEIDFNVLCVNTDSLQTRAKPFIQLLPKVKNITYKVVSSEHYNRVAWSHHSLKSIITQPSRTHEYACNKPMEEGIRLDALDSGMQVEWDVKFNVPEAKVRTDSYILMYVSGSKTDYTWTPMVWANFYREMRHKYKLERLNLVLFGTHYDATPLQQIAQILARYNIRATVETKHDANTSIRLIRDAAMFIGYQSGLNVIADNYNVPQIMIYFPFLKPMLNTWCKPGHAESKLFNAFTFDQSPAQIMQECKPVCDLVTSRLAVPTTPVSPVIKKPAQAPGFIPYRYG